MYVLYTYHLWVCLKMRDIGISGYHIVWPPETMGFRSVTRFWGIQTGIHGSPTHRDPLKKKIRVEPNRKIPWYLVGTSCKYHGIGDVELILQVVGMYNILPYTLTKMHVELNDANHSRFSQGRATKKGFLKIDR